MVVLIEMDQKRQKHTRVEIEDLIIDHLKGVVRKTTHVKDILVNENKKGFRVKGEAYDRWYDAELKSGRVVFIEFAKPIETCHS